MSEEVQDDLSPEQEIREAIELFIPAGVPVEIRALGPGKETNSGYYDDVDKLIRGALRLSEKADGIYFMPNPFNPALAARSHNKMTKYPKSTTSDSDITRRKWLLIDCDPERPSGISASNAEHDAALGKALSISRFLRKEQGFVGIVVADSGNGGHVLVPIDLPNDENATKLLSRVLEALSFLFDDEVVKVDQTTFNAARICKLYGTMARKGSDTSERPHRMASIYGTQQKRGTVTQEQLEAVAALAPEPAPQSTPAARAGTTSKSDLEEWIAGSGLLVVSSGKWKDGKKWILNPCHWNPEHTNNAAFIIQQANGAIAAGCRHNSCKGKGWHELRDVVEPGWRNRRKASNKGDAAGKAGFQPAKEPQKGPLKPLYQFDLPPFPTEALPGWMREYVEAVAEATQTPSDMAGVMLLAACAVAAQKKVVIEAGAGWSEQLSLYAAVVMPPAARKSPVVNHIIKPVEDFEKLEMQMQITENAESQNRKAILEARLKEAQKKAAGTRRGLDGKEDHTEAEAEAEEIAREIATLPPPTRFRLLAEDATPEMLTVLLANNGGRMAVLSAEGDIFDIIGGRYSDSGKGPNLSVYLKSHPGEDLRVDRIGRKQEFVEKPALTMGLAVQPQVISGLMGEDVLRGRGLLARFLFSLPKNNIGYRRTHDEPIPYPTMREYRQKMTDLLSLRYDLTDDGDQKPHFLQLSPETKRVFDEYRARIEVRLRPSGDLYHIQDWGGKLAGAVARLAGLSHLASRAGLSHPGEVQVTVETMRAAMQLGDYFTEHARAAFARMAADPELDNAQHILEWVVQKEFMEFSKRDAHHDLMGRFKKADDLDAPLQLLIDRHFITLKLMPETAGPGRKPSPVFEVNPEVAEMGATELTDSTKSYSDADSEEDQAEATNSFVNSVNSVEENEASEDEASAANSPNSNYRRPNAYEGQGAGEWDN